MLKGYPDVMKPTDVMEALGIGKNTLYSLLQTGELPARRVGGKLWRIKKKDLIAYIKNDTRL